MFYIHKRRLSYFYIFWCLAQTPPPPSHLRLLRPLPLLNSWSGSDRPPIYQDPPFIRHFRVCAFNVIYMRSTLLMCVQCYLCAYNIVFLCVQWYLCTSMQLVHTSQFNYTKWYLRVKYFSRCRLSYCELLLILKFNFQTVR